tara:strand:+ start:171 stop:428 length:258 start_codon:yes stop_codon:yes gene_type:complete
MMAVTSQFDMVPQELCHSGQGPYEQIDNYVAVLHGIHADTADSRGVLEQAKIKVVRIPEKASRYTCFKAICGLRQIAATACRDPD